MNNKNKNHIKAVKDLANVLRPTFHAQVNLEKLICKKADYTMSNYNAT